MMQPYGSGGMDLQDPKIKLVDVTKVFKTRSKDIVAVKDVNMEVFPGDFVAILGPSGCGKSTIIRMINDIIAPSFGQMYIDGQEIVSRKTGKDLIRRMGFIFQQPNLFPWLTVRQNVSLPLKVFGLQGKKWEMNVDSLIEMAGLKEYEHAYPAEISGGMMQKVGVIRAMVHDPEILLMDEPFGALDEITREQLDLELLTIWEQTKKTIIFITHEVEEAVLLASKVYVMSTNPGRIVAEVEIDLPRPRTLEMIEDQAFITYEMELTNMIGKVELKHIK
jgi:NitT/TauT family transport system ATP-binding protein